MDGNPDSPFPRLVHKLDNTLTGMRSLLAMTNGIISSADRMLAEWAPHIEIDHCRQTVCDALATLYSCPEPTLSVGSHTVMNQSFVLFHQRVAKIQPCATRQLDELLEVHDLVSQAWEFARADELASIYVARLHRNFGFVRPRLETAHATQLHCDGLRCVLQVAMDATRQLVGTLNALGGVESPSLELVQLRIVLGSLEDRKAAVADAAINLAHVLI
ncbi:hypothetical protein AURDEDRAFT_177317 [Auricularia subglabra TFB-10046 SS5]|uniref:Uncharacterized protein n=1 Tax=Auricularia subglabra (strain TFB-10046 / SS5) TaxID=717982 RepID=J0WP10_AURST|nr:hypothetical protein AURDEDRAFT_177317 [Auricularia subglabra TFB-10046 SS5]